MNRPRWLLVGLGVVLMLVGVGSVFVGPQLHHREHGPNGVVRVTIGCFTPWQQWSGSGLGPFDFEDPGIDSVSASGNAYIPLYPDECEAATARHEHYAEGLVVAGALLVFASPLLFGRRPSRMAPVARPGQDHEQR